MVRSQLAFLSALFGLALGQSPASACSRAVRHYSDKEISQMAARAFASATTIADGEVIAPMAAGLDLPEGTLPVAYIRVSRTWKGQIDSQYDNVVPVAYLSSCDVFLGTKGQKLRILLNGTGIFTADQETNGWASVNEGDAFNREIDRLIGQPRPGDFTDPGEPPPVKKK